MNYRIILMGAGLLMMFAVYGAVMMIGAIVGENDAVYGNGAMALAFTILSGAALAVGMNKRGKAQMLVNQVIDAEMSSHGYVDALRFSQGAGVSLDDARDILNRKATEQGWSCVELDGYNAEYRAK